MAKPTLEFWFEFASTYSYIAAMRIQALAAEAEVEIAWRPFLLGPIFKAQGWADSPFNLYSAKGAYMWRDMERQCARFGLPIRRPSVFPRNGLAAARVATAAEGQAWAPDFVRAVYLANFSQDRDIADAGVLADALTAASAPEPARWLAESGTPETKARLRSRTEEAISRGIFGAPSFVARGELFWGSDRIAEALAYANGSDGL
jgi:2-hydroxychromene-2-carboxylate isomerase